MGNQAIELLGTTPASHFPQFPPHHPCTQFCQSDTLYLPSKKIKVEHIRQVHLTVFIHSFKIICTPAGNKLIIDGKKQIKVFLFGKHSHQPLYPLLFDIPFCTFVLLKDMKGDVVDICTVVEDLFVQSTDARSLTIASVIFVCPILKKDHQLCPCPPPSPHQSTCTNCHACLNLL